MNLRMKASIYENNTPYDETVNNSTIESLEKLFGDVLPESKAENNEEISIAPIISNNFKSTNEIIDDKEDYEAFEKMLKMED